MYKFSITVAGDEKRIGACIEQVCAATLHGQWDRPDARSDVLHFTDLRDVVEAEAIFRRVGLIVRRGVVPNVPLPADSGSGSTWNPNERSYLRLVR